MKRMGIGLQLYTVRQEMEHDFEGTLRQVAAMGYEGVEFAGYGGIPAEDMRKLLAELGLKAIGSHIPLTRLQHALDEEIDYLLTIGGRYAICPWLAAEDRADTEAWKRLFGQLNVFSRQVKDRGLRMAYHNHDFEFNDRIGERTAFDVLFASVPEDDLLVEMDTGWIQFSGFDPVAYLNAYAGRTPLVHLKDYLRTGTAGGIPTVELGKGELPLMNIMQAASDAGAEWLIVEQDRCDNPPLQSVEESFIWLKEHYLPVAH